MFSMKYININTVQYNKAIDQSAAIIRVELMLDMYIYVVSTSSTFKVGCIRLP